MEKCTNMAACARFTPEILHKPPRQSSNGNPLYSLELFSFIEELPCLVYFDCKTLCYLLILLSFHFSVFFPSTIDCAY